MTRNPATSTTAVVTLIPNSFAFSSEAAIRRSAVLINRDIVLVPSPLSQRLFLTVGVIGQLDQRAVGITDIAERGVVLRAIERLGVAHADRLQVRQHLVPVLDFDGE